MKDTFSDLFKTSRQNANMSIKQVANALNKSDGYFRKIENYDFTPPTYDVCNQLAKLFKLNKKDRQYFMKAAFLERTKTEKAFLDEFSISNNQSKSNPAPLKDQYQYFIQLKTYESQNLITPEIAKKIINFIENLGTTPQFKSIQIECYSDTLTLIIEPISPLNIISYVDGIKPLIAGIINNHIKAISTPIWNNSHKILTIGNYPDAYQKIKKTAIIEKIITPSV